MPEAGEPGTEEGPGETDPSSPTMDPPGTPRPGASGDRHARRRDEEQLPTGDEVRNHFLQVCFSDPFYLPRLMGYDKLTEKNLEWLLWALDTQRGMLLAPPQHFKSTTISVVLPLLLLLLNPDECGFIGGKTLEKASDFIRAIRSAIRTIPALGDVLRDPNAQDSDQGLIVRRSVLRHDPSLKPIAPGADMSKSHADWAILDDLVGTEDGRSQAARDATIKWFLQSFLRSMNKGAKIILVGQRWHEADLYGYVEENAKSMGFECLVEPAIRDGRPLAPEIFTADELEAERAALTSPLFELQWNQNAAPMSGKFFEWSWFKKYRVLPGGPEDWEDYQGIDLAISKAETAHYTVIATFGKHKPTGDVYLKHIRRGRLGYAEQLRAAEDEAATWKPIMRGVEEVYYQKAFTEIASRSKWPIRGMKAGTDKVSHARRFQGLAQTGKVWVPDPEQCEWSREYLKEVCAFPVSGGKGYDDQVDASSYAIDLIMGTGSRSAGVTVNPQSGIQRGSMSGLGRRFGSWKPRGP